MSWTRQQQKGTLHFLDLVRRALDGERVVLATPNLEESLMELKIAFDETLLASLRDADDRIVQLEQEVISLCELIDEQEKQLQELRHDMMLEVALLKEAIKCT